jgi:ankyrin repeat protein
MRPKRCLVYQRAVRACQSGAAGPAGASEAANARDGDDETPLHMAARGGYPEIVRMLLAAGAKADAKSAAGLFPWNYAEDGSELHALLPRCE